MNHTIEQLMTAAYELFPKGMQGDEPGYADTPEVKNQRRATAKARASHAAWRSVLRALEETYPEKQFPGVSVQNLSMGLLAEHGDADDRCFAANLWLPTRGTDEHAHYILFRVSFVVPYFSIHSTSLKYTDVYFTTMRLAPGALRAYDSPMLSEDELPFGRKIDEAIRAAFPGYEAMSTSVGNTIVPDIVVGGHFFGEATLFDALFSVHWR
ncbi:MAG: hypothetical protein U0441_20245 [Polyangiaceae bacterium]